MFHGGLAWLMVLVGACAPVARPILAEIFYDPLGDDTGLEFVELFNPSPAALPLAGARLEAGDGAGPGRWTPRWTAAAADSIPAHGRFVIGGAGVMPAPQAIASLDLQNGPDAVRIVWPDGAAEVVGYGALGDSAYYCGSPAPDVPSGQSLARVPDDADLGGNGLDFHASTPSPGRANRATRDVALIGGSLVLVPEQPAPGAAAKLSGAIGNLGAVPLDPGEPGVVGEEIAETGTRELFSTAVERALLPGDTARFAVALPGLEAGRRTLRVRARLGGDERAENDLDSLRVRVGPGPLELTEVQFHPAAGEGEWVEVRNRSGEPLDLAAFRLADRRGGLGTPAGGTSPLAAESLAVLAQDRTALMARLGRLDPARVWQVSPWSSLNNSDDSSGVADIVNLREADGTACDHLDYSAAGVPSGATLERHEGERWTPSAEPGGTPLAPPRALAPIGGRFEILPRRLRPGLGTARIGWALPWPRARIAIEVWDLDGRRVSVILPETAVGARGERSWSPAAPAGLYLVVLRARAEEGDGALTSTLPVRVEGRVP